MRGSISNPDVSRSNRLTATSHNSSQWSENNNGSHTHYELFQSHIAVLTCKPTSACNNVLRHERAKSVCESVLGI